MGWMASPQDQQPAPAQNMEIDLNLDLNPDMQEVIIHPAVVAPGAMNGDFLELNGFLQEAEEEEEAIQPVEHPGLNLNDPPVD